MVLGQGPCQQAEGPVCNLQIPNGGRREFVATGYGLSPANRS